MPSTPGEAQLEFTIGEEGAFVLQVKVRLPFQRAATSYAGLHALRLGQRHSTQ